MTPAEIIQADHKESVGIDGFARANVVIPPARFVIGHIMVASGMMMAGQRMTDQHCIAACCIQRAVGFVQDAHRRECAAGRQLYWSGKVDMLRGDNTHGINRISAGIARGIPVQASE